MDDGGLAPELGYLGVPGLGVYAYTHWEWGQSLGALAQPVASISFLSTWRLGFCTVAPGQGGGRGDGFLSKRLEVGSRCTRCCVFPSPQSGVWIFSGHPSPHLRPPPPLPSDWTSSVTPWDFSSSGCCPSELMGQMHVGSGVVFV